MAETDDEDILDIDLEKKVKESEEEQKRRRRRELNDLIKVLDIPEGRRVLWRLLSEAGVYRSSFTENSNRTAFNEGRRDIGLLLLKDVNLAKPNAFAQMQREYVSELNARKENKK